MNRKPLARKGKAQMCDGRSPVSPGRRARSGSLPRQRAGTRAKRPRLSPLASSFLRMLKGWGFKVKTVTARDIEQAREGKWLGQKFVEYAKGPELEKKARRGGRVSNNT